MPFKFTTTISYNRSKSFNSIYLALMVTTLQGYKAHCLLKLEPQTKMLEKIRFDC